MKPHIWQPAIFAACVLYGKPSKQQILEIALEKYPEEMDVLGKALLRRTFLNDLSMEMKDLSGPETSEKYTQGSLDLPGMDAPTYITARTSTGELTVVLYEDSVRTERRSAIREREIVVERIKLRIKDLKEKELFLSKYTRDDKTTVKQALEAMKRDMNAA